jgi:hypothetical protein
MALRALLPGLILALSLLSSAHAVVPELRQPSWAELTLEQKQILAPLSRDWDKMEAPPQEEMVRHRQALPFHEA